MTSDELYVLRWAALLHDVGKTIIPAEVLLKPGPLTTAEYQIVKTHSQSGADAVSAISPSLASIANAILAHHERWDGLGYPIGLTKSSIPLAARIIAVADVFEALTSERPYRNAFDLDTALEFIRAGSGNQFDPDIVVMFESMLEFEVSQERLQGLRLQRAAGLGVGFAVEAGLTAQLKVHESDSRLAYISGMERTPP